MGLNTIGGSSGGGISPGDDAAQLGSGAAPDGYVLVADGSGGADWEALVGGGGGTVTSVAVSGSDGIEVDSGSPITASGTISLGVNASNLKTHLSLNNVENTALSTWAGSTSVTTIGTIATGTVPVANVSGLGDSATKNTGTSAGTVAAGDHTHAEFHSPVTVSGNGISIAGQQVSLNIGTGESQVAAGNDARFTDSRNPTAHASSHVTGGSDKIRDASASQDGLMTAAYASKLDGIAASANNYSHPNHTGDVTSSGDGATTIANLAVTAAKISSGVASNGHVLTSDGAGNASWSAVSGANGGTVTSVALSGTDGIEIDSGSPLTSSGTIALGINSSTLKTHIALNNVENTALSTWVGSTAITTLGTIATGTVPAANVSGLGGAATLNVGSTTGTVCAGDDSRLSDARTPTGHASSHVTGGTDKIRDASASQDGLMTTAYATKLDGIDEHANNYTLPAPTTTVLGGVKRNTGSAGQFVSGIDSNGALEYGTPAGSGDVTGPASSVDNRIPIFVGTGGKTIEDSGVTLTPAFAGTSEVFTINFSAVSDPGSIWSGWLVIHDDAGSVGLWWRESTQANSAPVGLTADRLIQINITIPGSNENAYIATETAAALDADSAFSASASGTVVTCTVTAVGAITGSFSSGISGLAEACTVTTEGADPYIASISQIDGSLIEAIDPLKIDATGTTDSTTFLRGDGSWAVPAYPPGLTDGDKGDISVSFSGTAWTIDAEAVTLAKMANMATASLLGRSTAGTGSPEVLSASSARSLLNVADGANNYSHPNHTGDVTSTGDGATTIANDAVTTAKIINDAVTYAKIQNISATSRVIGRKSSGSGDAEECTLSDILDFVGSAAQGDILYRGASTWTRLAAGTSGHYLKTLGSGANPEWAAVPTNGQLGIVIDGAGSVITTGEKGYLRVPYNCTITSVEIVANASGSIVVDIWKDSYANFPPTVADSITGSAKPTLSSAQKSQSSTLTGWTTSLSAGDYLAFNVDSATTVSRVTLTLIVTRTT